MMLRRLRMNAGITADQAARELEMSQSKMTRIEGGTAAIRQLELERLGQIYQLNPEQVDELIVVMRASRQSGWWERHREALKVAGGINYIEFEDHATEIRSYDHLIPGLFQTADYARAVFRIGNPRLGDRQIEQFVELRLARQAILDRPNRPYLWAIIDEAALRRMVGSEKIMITQLERLAEIADEGRAHVQVLPFEAGLHAAADSAFVVLDFGDDVPSLAYYEYAGMANAWIEHPPTISRLRSIHLGLISEAPHMSETRSFIARTIDGIRSRR